MRPWLVVVLVATAACSFDYERLRAKTDASMADRVGSSGLEVVP